MVKVVIIQKDNKPLMFSNGVVVVYPSIKEAYKDFNNEHDVSVMTLQDYLKSDMYKVYNNLSIGM